MNGWNRLRHRKARQHDLADEQGAVVLWMLVSLPVLFVVFFYLLNWHLAVTSSDVNLTRALESAVKAAAMQVDAESQAVGEPRIDSGRAFLVFKEKLNENLGVGEGSLIAAAECRILIYNGDAKYAGSGMYYGFLLPGNTMFMPVNVPAAGFPAVFSLARQGYIDFQGSGKPEVMLETPGVIAVVKAKVKQGLFGGKVETVRWAAARVVRGNMQ